MRDEDDVSHVERRCDASLPLSPLSLFFFFFDLLSSLLWLVVRLSLVLIDSLVCVSVRLGNQKQTLRSEANPRRKNSLLDDGAFSIMALRGRRGGNGSSVTFFCERGEIYSVCL